MENERKNGEPAAAPNPLDPLGVSAAAADVWRAMLGAPEDVVATQVEFAKKWMEVATSAWGPPAQRTPIIEPAKGDNRFKHPAWTENPLFDSLKQGYLLATKAVLDSIDNAPDVDPETRHRVRFFAKQFCDAMSPTNFAFLNPAVIDETLRTGGANLKRGAELAADDLRDNEGRVTLVDTKAFTVGGNVATTPGSVVFRNELIELIEYTPTTETVYERPLVIVPPWINKFYILDLQPANSLIKYAVDNGIRTYVVSWKNPDASLANLEMQDYLRLGPLTAARVAAQISKTKTVNFVGYCIGGTLLAMLLAYIARTDDPIAGSATFFAALTDFADSGDLRAFLSPQALATVDEKMSEQGVLGGRYMADTFSLLRANDLIWNAAVNRYLLGRDAPAFDLLYWNNDATRMPRAMHAYYLRNMYGENNLVKPDVLSVNGVPIDLHRVKNDVYCVATLEDHIAPWRAVYQMTQLFGGDTRFRLGHSGHIAGIINAPGKNTGSWLGNSANPPNPDEWLANATEHPGSWWPDWLAWLAERSGERVPAPKKAGNKQYRRLEAAPGTYVSEK